MSTITRAAGKAASSAAGDGRAARHHRHEDRQVDERDEHPVVRAERHLHDEVDQLGAGQHHEPGTRGRPQEQHHGRARRRGCSRGCPARARGRGEVDDVRHAPTSARTGGWRRERRSAPTAGATEIAGLGWGADSDGSLGHAWVSSGVRAAPLGHIRTRALGRHSATISTGLARRPDPNGSGPLVAPAAVHQRVVLVADHDVLDRRRDQRRPADLGLDSSRRRPRRSLPRGRGPQAVSCQVACANGPPGAGAVPANASARSRCSQASRLYDDPAGRARRPRRGRSRGRPGPARDPAPRPRPSATTRSARPARGRSRRSRATPLRPAGRGAGGPGRAPTPGRGTGGCRGWSRVDPRRGCGAGAAVTPQLRGCDRFRAETCRRLQLRS